MNRSTFLKTLGLSAVAGMANPLTAPAAASLLPPSVRITDVRAYLFKKACYVKVETDAGISGWGESDGANKKITPLYLQKMLRPYLLGKDPFDSEGIWHEAYLKGLEAGVGGIHPGTLAGVDNALWDLKGKLLEVPVYKLLGGNGRRKIQVYGSYGRDKGNYQYRTPKEMAEIAADFVAQGYKAVKARMQSRQENVNPYPDDIHACVKEIRAAIGDDIRLFIDFNNGYTPAQATVVARRLYEDFNIAAL
ncbi:MAG: enolase C-terminal domain-like protein, partial [Bacteroidota bacterium]